MNYGKIIICLIILVVGAAFWNRARENNRIYQHQADNFARVYAATAVVAELYRLEPDRFLRARDSIYASYQFNSDSMRNFHQRLAGQEEKWGEVWQQVWNLVDSLTHYYRDHPVSHPPADSGGSAGHSGPRN